MQRTGGTMFFIIFAVLLLISIVVLLNPPLQEKVVSGNLGDITLDDVLGNTGDGNETSDPSTNDDGDGTAQDGTG